MKNCHGFTLAEILTAVIIVTILVVMAVPLYEKTIERSRLAEARTIMNNLQTAKLEAMAAMYCGETFNPTGENACPVRMKHLRMAVNEAAASAGGYTFSTDAFTYSISPTTSGYENGVCAKRKGGENNGVTFLHLQEDGSKTSTFLCHGTSGQCEYYGLDDTTFACNF